MGAMIRRLGFFVLGAVLACVPLSIGGCAGTIGSDRTQNIAKIDTRNGSPVSLDMVDADGTWSVNGVGPARYSSITDKGIDTLQTGTTPRDIVFTRAKDGVMRFGFNSGTDFRAGLVKFDPVTGALEIRDFDSSASAPLKALERITELVTAYHAARDQASKDAIIAEIQMIGAVIPEVAAKIVEALKKAPLPVP